MPEPTPARSTDQPATQPADPAEPRPRGKGGRKRDPTRDRVIIDATIEVLAEVGYEGLTMSLVAERAHAGKATLYRRWPSKADLVLDAAASVKGQLDIDDLPDTGSLRSDFAAVFTEQPPEEIARILQAMAGLSSVMAADTDLADAANAAVVGPFVTVNRILMQRAIDRGEIPAGADIETIAQVTPLMTAFRLLVQRKPLDIPALFHLIDVVVIPALLAAPADVRDEAGPT